MKKLQKIFFTLAALIVAEFAVAQSNILNALSPEEMGEQSIEDIYAKADGPIPYEYVNDNDVVYQKFVWEIIPLDQKQNLVYYFPLDEDIPGRKSLFNALKDVVMTQKVKAYETDRLTKPLNLSQVENSFFRIDTLPEGIDQYILEGKIDPQYIDKIELRPTDVKEFRIKGMWYIDRNAGALKYRLLAIAPVVTDIATKGEEFEQAVPLFWIFFPDVRETLYNTYAYNEKNPAMKLNFDYLLNSRKFAGTIYKEDNIYGDREINEYVKENAMMQLLEAERIKESIRNLEDDLWNY